MVAQIILLHPYLPRKSDNSTSHLDMDPKNAQFLLFFHGWKMFQLDFKSKPLQPVGVAALLLKHMLLLQLGLLYLQPLPAHHITTTISFINLHAIVTVGT